jgi:hypothetical protein
MLLYTHRELADIKGLLKVNRKFEYIGNRLVFSNSDGGKYLMQRIKNNKYLGITLDTARQQPNRSDKK